LEEYLHAFDDILRSSINTLAFTGAGVSWESGIPTFRGSGGIWEQYPPSMYGNLPGLAVVFVLRGKKLAGFAAEVVSTLVEASPNPCHSALARMEEEDMLKGIITQNVDDLHSLAGSKKVLELHGNAYRLKCSRCRSTRKMERERLVEVAQRLKQPGVKRRDLLGALRHYASRCSECGGRTRPDVVFFGESLPPGAMDESVLLASECELLLVLGTTSVVYPAALVPRVAMDAGARIVEINPQPTNLTPLADLSIPYPAGDFFATYMKMAGWE